VTNRNTCESHPNEMFSTASQHLTVKSPSVSTISYTISNASPRSTPSSKAWAVLGHLFRILLCLFIFAVDVAKLESASDLHLLPVDIVGFQNSLPGRLALSTANATDWRIVAAGSPVLIYLCLKKAYTGEDSSDPFRQGCCSSVYRRDPSGSSRSWSANLYLILNLSIDLHDEIHTHDPDPRYHNPRSI
jgi:hypothetical protein